MATPLEDEPTEVGENHLAKHGWSPGRHGRDDREMSDKKSKAPAA
jgi:hypothetical protein